jgi:hypothetical protein
MTIARKIVLPALAAALLVLVVGCIPVKDVSRGWAMAEPDEALNGRWVGKFNTSDTVAFAMTDADFLVTSGSAGLDGAVRTLQVGDHRYLIVAGLRAALEGFEEMDDFSKSGNLLRYTLADDTLTIYQFDSTALENAIDNGDVAGINNEEESTTVLALDDDTIDWLEDVAGDDDLWTETVYVRKDE